MIGLVCLLWAVEGLSDGTSSGQSQGISVREGGYVIRVKPADQDILGKVREQVRKELERQRQEHKAVSLSRLKKELGKEALRKGGEIARDHHLWYLTYPVDTAMETVEGLEDFQRYLSRLVGGETEIEVSDDEVGVFFKKTFRF